MEIELLIERLLMQHTLKRSEVDSLCQKAAQLIEELQAENERLKGADDMVLIPKKLCPIVTKNGVSFGDVWFSHEKILGRKMTDNWEAGKPLEPKGLTEEQYFKWAAQMRALTNEVK